MKHHKTSRLPQLLILGGVVLLAITLLSFKIGSKAEATTTSGELPQVQLDTALKAGKPTLAFFHSNSCEQCFIMIKTIDQVFPKFSASITLVDIDVYDDKNAPLLRRVGLQYIPTLIFYDQKGQSETFVGVMTAGELQAKLAALSGVE